MPEAVLSSLAVYSARPTIRINSREDAKINGLLIGMTMTEQEGGMSALEVRFSNWASDSQNSASYAFEDDRILKLGGSIAIYTGDENGPREIFQGTITGLEADFTEEGPPELVVLAEDVFQQARMARRTTLHDNVSIADLAEQLANQLSLRPNIIGLRQNIGNQMQLNESDLAFLRRILAHYDGDMQVVGEELQVFPRADARRSALELQLHSQLHRAKVLADLAHQVTEVTVSGWDAVQGERISSRSRGANLGTGAGRTGAQVLQNTLGDRPHHLGHMAVSTSAEAQAIADAAFDQRARRFLCVEGTATGNPALRVGSHVTLTGMGDRFSNTYYVVQTCHRYNVEQGYQTDFTAECAYWGGR